MRTLMKNFVQIVQIWIVLSVAQEIEQPFNDNLCRTRNNVYLPQNEFNVQSCILCYRFMSNYSFKNKTPLEWSTLEALKKNHTNYENLLGNELALNSFVSSVNAEKWKKCCKAASQCCSNMLANKSQNENDNWCPKTWDGWLCWPESPPGNEKRKPCPSYALSTVENCKNSYALKKCDENGKWALHPLDKNNEWTNYTPCSMKNSIEKRFFTKIVSYGISIVALIPALIIFQTFRSLRCHRIILHKNLFVSLLFYCSFQVAFDVEFVLDDLSKNSRINKNELSCRILLIATKYFRVTNYMWMFCEGLYLRRQIVNVFAEEANLKIFYFIGWGIPIIPIILFVAFRQIMKNSDCWALPYEYVDWVLYLPCLLSLVINAVFLINIVTILITKLRSGHPDDEHVQFRKAVKATMVLVPLFGVHFLFTLYRQKSVCSTAEEIYVYVSSLLDGLQGFLVAFIFCFVNSEVIAAVKRYVKNLRDRRNINTLQSICNGTLTTEFPSQTTF